MTAHDKITLVSPIGLRPGVLYSALLTADPAEVSRCVVICSAETAKAIDPACQAAGFTGDVVPIQLNDPFPSADEIERRSAAAAVYLSTGIVCVNITGGTTLMGILAEQIAGVARRLGRSVHRFALVDRRPQSEQEADPFRQGEAYWLDRAPPDKEQR